MDNKFVYWLDELVKAWVNQEPEKAANLCEKNLLWYETPFEEPLSTKKGVLNEWKSVLKQKDIAVKYNIITHFGDTVIAHWYATFTRTETNESVLLDVFF